MNTINNTMIIQSKRKLLNTVNEILQSGMPISILDLMIDNISAEVKMTLQNQLQQEERQLAEQERVQSEQVEYIPEKTE